MIDQSPALLQDLERFVPAAVGGLESLSILDIYQLVMGLSAKTHRYGPRYLVRCPSQEHEDVHPSCLLKPKGDVWGCRACDAGGGKLDMVVAAGKARTRMDAREWLSRMTGRALYLAPQPGLKERERRDTPRGERRITEVYSYSDADGTVIEQCVRYVVTGDNLRRPKDFDMRRPDGAGSWIYHHRASCDRTTCPCHGNGPLARVVPPLVPYRLPELLAGGAQGRTGILVEGESDANRLAELGFIATTNPFGTEFEYPQAWKRWFAAVPRWVVIPDADLAGRKAAAERAAFIGPTAIVADLYPGRTDTKNGPDVSDWLREIEHGGTSTKTPTELKAALETTLREAIVKAGVRPRQS